jgi:hypothetical protein
MENKLKTNEMSREELQKEIEDLEQDLFHLRFKIKRSYHQDYFFDAEKYEHELKEVEIRINELKEKL